MGDTLGMRGLQGPPHSFWPAWPRFSWAQHALLLILFALGGYCLFGVSRACLRLRLNTKLTGADFTMIYSRIATLRQMLGASFFLFGFVLFRSLQLAVNTQLDGRGFVFTGIIENFIIDSAFAANVFVIFFGFCILPSGSHRLNCTHMLEKHHQSKTKAEQMRQRREAHLWV